MAHKQSSDSCLTLAELLASTVFCLAGHSAHYHGFKLATSTCTCHGFKLASSTRRLVCVVGKVSVYLVREA